jgi:SRSO17 transposase
MTRTRPATPTVAFLDEYCAQYRGLFHNVRPFEQFTALHLGLLAETRHKSLPRLGRTVHADPQALHHFLAKASWSVTDLRAKRLKLLRQAVGETPFMLGLDETGDRKKGHTTDYVAHQSIGNRHTASQRRGLGQCLRSLGHDDLPAALSHLQARVPPPARRGPQDEAAARE